jgi:hypothetical protein
VQALEKKKQFERYEREQAAAAQTSSEPAPQ